MSSDRMRPFNCPDHNCRFWTRSKRVFLLHLKIEHQKHCRSAKGSKINGTFNAKNWDKGHRKYSMLLITVEGKHFLLAGHLSNGYRHFIVQMLEIEDEAQKHAYKLVMFKGKQWYGYQGTTTSLSIAGEELAKTFQSLHFKWKIGQSLCDEDFKIRFTLNLYAL